MVVLNIGISLGVQTLLMMGSDINHRGNKSTLSTHSYSPIQTALHRVSISRNENDLDHAIEIVKLLLNNGADIKLKANFNFGHPPDAIELLNKMIKDKTEILQETDKRAFDYVLINKKVSTLSELRDLFELA
jgi:hypothetical protein